MCGGSYVACEPATHVVPHFAHVYGRRLKLTLYGTFSKVVLKKVAAQEEKVA